MNLPRIRFYPKHLNVNGQPYRIKFVKRFKDKAQVGECDPGDRIISIKRGIGQRETFFTLVHELLHAIEFEYGFNINHKLVYKLERCLSEIILENF